MKTRVACLFTAGMLALPALAQPDARSTLVRIFPPPGRSIADVLALDLDFTENFEDGVPEALVSRAERARIDALGFRVEVLLPDLRAFTERGLDQGLAAGIGLGSMGGYCTYAEIVQKLNEFRTRHPNLVSAPFSIGTSVEGRALWTIRVSDAPDAPQDRPRVWFDSLHHAREPLAVMCQLYFIDHLLTSHGIDPFVTDLLARRELYFTPCVNPDGYVYNQTTNPGGGGLWRKNRRNNGNGTFGVDLNRNYGFMWGFDNTGSSPTPSSEVYRGPSAFSEPETRATRDFLATIRPRLNLWISNHTYARTLQWAWGWQTALAPNDALLRALATDFVAVNGHTGLPTSVNGLVNGCTHDWGEGGAGGLLSFTFEFGTSFWPPTADILPSCFVNLDAHVQPAAAAGAYLRRTALTVTDVGNGNGFLDPGETGRVTFTVLNHGLQATPLAAVARLVTASAWAVPGPGVDLGVVASRASANNNASPLTFTVPDFATPGSRVGLSLRITTGDLTLVEDLSFVVGTPATVFADDFEADRGWTVGAPGDDATSGLWARGDPNPTTIYSAAFPVNPADDATPGAGVRCFVTGNAATTDPRQDDVDNGRTSLVSPVFDLAGKRWSWVELRSWYVDLGVADDALQTWLSSDGGANWTPGWSTVATENRWLRRDLRVRDHVRNTASTRFKIVARDAPENSICEAAVDDFLVRWYDDGVSFTTSGAPRVGSTVTLQVTSARDPGQPYAMGVSFSTAPGLPIGEGRTLELTPDALFFLAFGLPATFQNWVGTLDASGRAVPAPAFAIPGEPALAGLAPAFAFVTLHPAAPSGIENFSDSVRLTIVP